MIHWMCWCLMFYFSFICHRHGSQKYRYEFWLDVLVGDTVWTCQCVLFFLLSIWRRTNWSLSESHIVYTCAEEWVIRACAPVFWHIMPSYCTRWDQIELTAVQETGVMWNMNTRSGGECVCVGERVCETNVYLSTCFPQYCRGVSHCGFGSGICVRTGSHLVTSYSLKSTIHIFPENMNMNISPWIFSNLSVTDISVKSVKVLNLLV